MNSEKLIELIRNIDGVNTVENTPIDPMDPDEVFLIITFDIDQ